MAKKQSGMIPVPSEQVKEIPGVTKSFEVQATFAKRAVTPAEFKKAQESWIKSVPEPKTTEPSLVPITGVVITPTQVAALRAVHESPAPTAELVLRELGADRTLGIAYSTITAYEYHKMRAEYKAQSAKAKDKAAVKEQWQQVVRAAQAAFAAAGLPDLKEVDLDKMASAVSNNKGNFNAVATIASSGDNAPAVVTALREPKKKAAAPPDVAPAVFKRAIGNFVAQTGVLPDLVAVVTPIPNPCATPIQGSFTKHFSKTFSLQVTLTVWCPTWTNPFRTCKKTYTLAGVSFNVDLSVGYRITCCGAVAWGQAAVQACASIIGISVCAGCTATITAVAGTGKSGSGSSCSYGLGLTAALKCTFAGVTVLNVSAPFGWTLTGPCLPVCP